MTPALLATAASLGFLYWWRARVYPAGARKVLGYRKGQPLPLVVLPVGGGEYMAREAARALLQLLEAARAAGHRLTVTRGFAFNQEQAALYEAYQEGTGNLAARPGYSNHQQGLSADLGGVGSYTSAAYAWLKQHAAAYGFSNDVPGEHWHWTYTTGLKS